MQRYAELRDTLRTGDIVLFSGASGISEAIKFGSRSRWSHVGMILRDDVNDVVLVFESTTITSVPDAILGMAIKGVQVVSLSKRIEDYKGEIAVRRLVGERTPAVLDGFRIARREFHGRPYEQRVLDLILAEYDGPFGRVASDASSLFCSEVVGLAYQRAGLLPSTVVACELVPRDWSSEGSRYPTDWVEPRLTPYLLEAEIGIQRDEA